MSIQSITANAQGTPVVTTGTPKPANAPELRTGGGLPPEASNKSETAVQGSSANRAESDKEVKEAVDNIQKFVAQTTRDITFSIDESAGFMVKVIDRTSQDVIRQIPSEEVVAIARALDKLQGLFVRDKI